MFIISTDDSWVTIKIKSKAFQT